MQRVFFVVIYRNYMNEKSNIVDEWYRVEYSYYETDVPSVTYKNHKSINTRKGAEEFIALILYLSEHNWKNSKKQQRLTDKLLGPGRAVKKLTNFYKYIKLEIPIKGKL